MQNVSPAQCLPLTLEKKKGPEPKLAMLRVKYMLCQKSVTSCEADSHVYTVVVPGDKGAAPEEREEGVLIKSLPMVAMSARFVQNWPL